MEETIHIGTTYKDLHPYFFVTLVNGDTEVDVTDVVKNTLQKIVIVNELQKAPKATLHFQYAVSDALKGDAIPPWVAIPNLNASSYKISIEAGYLGVPATDKLIMDAYNVTIKKPEDKTVAVTSGNVSKTVEQVTKDLEGSDKISMDTKDLTIVGVPKRKVLFTGSIISGNFNGDDNGVISYTLECGMKNSSGVYAATSSRSTQAPICTRRAWLNTLIKSETDAEELLLTTMGLEKSSDEFGYKVRDTALAGSKRILDFLKKTNTYINLDALKGYKLSLIKVSDAVSNRRSSAVPAAASGSGIRSQSNTPPVFGPGTKGALINALLNPRGFRSDSMSFYEYAEFLANKMEISYVVVHNKVNTAVGKSSLSANTTGNGNVAIGHQAGYNTTTGGPLIS